jgi:predicted negative regulator of RcsB-dependent stress response
MPEDTSPPITPLAEIHLGPSKFEQFLENNQKLLTVLLGLLVVASATYIVIRGVEKSREQTAGAALSKAVGPTALKEVIDQHANTKASASAKLLLADVQISDGKTDDAMQTLRDFIANHPDHAAKPTANAKLAAQLMSQGKSAEASTIFQDIVADPSARYIAPYALICLGDIAKAGGDPAKAESHFKQIQTEFPESSFASIAADRLASVYTKAPVEVEPPPPAPEPKKAEPEKKPAPPAAESKAPEKKSAPKPATKSSSKSTKTAPKSIKAKN